MSYKETLLLLTGCILILTSIMILYSYIPKLIDLIKKSRLAEPEVGDTIKAYPPTWVESWHTYISENWEVVEVGKNAIRVRCEIIDPAYQTRKSPFGGVLNKTNSGEQNDGYYYTDISKHILKEHYYVVNNSKHRIKKKFYKSFID